MIRYHFWQAADSLVHFLWPCRHGAHYRALPCWLKWVCDRYDALIWQEFD